jgi:DNA polymerase I-like protein with 3'-5' exonuclease and polymerase domains
MLGLRAPHQRLRQEQLQSRIIGTVHDNLVLEVPQRELGRATRALQETCEHPATREFGFTLSVPLVMDVKVGPTWAALEEVSG